MFTVKPFILLLLITVASSGFSGVEAQVTDTVSAPVKSIRIFIHHLAVDSIKDIKSKKNVPMLNYKKHNDIVIRWDDPSNKTDSISQPAYRLTGYDNKWIKPEINDRFTRYTRLPKGRYTFELTYHYNNKIHNISTPFMIQPTFWQTWLFKVLLVSAKITFLIIII